MIFVGYSFQPRPNSCMLATAGSTMTIGLSINRCLQFKKNTLTRQNKINQSKNFSHGDLDLEKTQCGELPEKVISRVYIPVILPPENGKTKTP